MIESYVENVDIDMTARRVILYGTNLESETIQCDNYTQFMNVLRVIKEYSKYNNESGTNFSVNYTY